MVESTARSRLIDLSLVYFFGIGRALQSRPHSHIKASSDLSG
jgi:hypothetical protein